MPSHQSEPQKNNAFTAMVLRLAVAGYIAYLGYQIITNQETTMKPFTAWLLGGALILAAGAFCVYIGIRWKADKKAIENTGDPADQEKESNNDSTN